MIFSCRLRCMLASYVSSTHPIHRKGFIDEAFFLRILRPAGPFRQSFLRFLRSSSGLRAGAAFNGGTFARG